jgi:hypothetical protein
VPPDDLDRQARQRLVDYPPLLDALHRDIDAREFAVEIDQLVAVDVQ